MKRLIVLFMSLCLLTGCTASAGEIPEAELQEMITTGDFTDRSQPPALHVTSRNTYTQGLAGTCSWEWRNTFGIWQAMFRDSMHPLSCRDLLEEMHAGEKEAVLVFGAVPDQLVVRCWPDSQWGNPDAEPITIPVDGQTIALLEGGYIYEVMARWDKTEYRRFAGRAWYCFYAIAE